MKSTVFRIFTVAVILAMAFSTFLSPAGTVQAAGPTELFFSEYIEGTSNNKALEIYNGTGAAVNLAAGGYNVQMYFNGSASAGLTINLTGAVADGDVYVLAHSSANATILAQADQTNGAGWFNGDDAVVLRKGTTIIDAIGQIGFDPGTEWGTGLTSTADNTLRRKNTITAGDTNGSDAFDPAVEWDGYATDTFGGLGSHSIVVVETAPSVTGTYPTNGATDVPINADLTVTFSEPVNVSGGWYSLNCTAGGTMTGVVSGGPTTFTINPSSDFISGDTCSLTINAANVTDQDLIDPPDNMTVDFVVGFSTQNFCILPFTPIYDIQGSGATAAITGTVTTQGVVVGDYEGASPTLRGFFLQDATGDGNSETSDGIFVFNGSNNSVNLGDLVRVTGSAAEYQGQTQISASSVVKCGSGSVTPVDVTLPFSAVDFPERYEGMLVRLPQTLYVTEHYLLGRFGQITLSSGHRLWQPTSLFPPGIDADDLQTANNLNSLILDDAMNNQNPDPILFGRGGQPLSAANTLRGGDTATGIVGVMTYTYGGSSTASPNAYRVRPINALGGGVPDFQAANTRPDTPADVGGSLRVAGMNLLNYFNTFDGASSNPPYACTLGVGGALTDCRGADDAFEYQRQWQKTLTAIAFLQADVLGLVELENDGYGPESAIADLVGKLNDYTAPGTYAFIDADAATGQLNALGTDAIKVGLIYQPGFVTPVGTTAVLNSVEFVNGGDTSARNRPALAQTFEQNASGARFTVVVNHFKSKGSLCDDGDPGGLQGGCNTVRVNAANALAAWLATDPTGAGSANVLIVGDLNSYAKEDPIAALEAQGYTNLIATMIGPEAYSYVFNGQWGYLDHAIGSAALAPQVTGVAEPHINADEPSVLDYNTNYKSPGQITSLYNGDQYRISDHDPVLVGLELNVPPVVGPISAPVDPVMVGTAIDASASFTDFNLLDTHTATWDWGDGTTSSGTVVEAGGSGSVTGSHTYTAAGVYQVTLTVADPYGATGQAVYEYVVVYDPNGGFVTGGGWIDSPPGAYLPDPTLSGKATFGFVSKYVKGAQTPQGNTEFQFKAAGLNFKSTTYEWLVIAGAKAQYKGTGTINNEGVYGFMLTATDGQLNGSGVDRLRLKIWDKSSGEVIYDNLFGASDTVNPVTALGGGSIVVHKSK